ncbi:Chorismate--pyruvate lyase [Pragia fontium]|uniref:chorismate lyase n=1 Tax=Pragia fontium TaxID=82985 RepID=UPI00064AAA7A|nr:chorismate lyase [Pragia fontium]AKJ43331.1 chorismate--pyruvate lyase [Pragia fontium]SUB83801.1 Chorismate--pyruvate lyase [Pragia fontium]
MVNQTLSAPNWKDRNWDSSAAHLLTQSVSDWLLEEDSMTSRCERYCQNVMVKPLFEGYVSFDLLGKEISELPIDTRYWIREILLFGDTMPWIWARTVVPEKTLCGPEQRLTALGDMPLGRYLFSHAELERDYIQVSLFDDLWGRRSRLCLSGKPLLLTEIFLPSAPLY